jgi:acylphosphatase
MFHVKQTEENPQLHVAIHGHVQGVGFRAFVIHYAKRFGVAGFVRNRADGTVEVAASGTAAALQSLRDILLAGPPNATVRRLEELGYCTDTLEEPFSIRY